MRHVCYILLLTFPVLLTGSCNSKQKTGDEYTIASYYFPNYHVDNRNVKVHGEGWTEWELVKNARPRFEGHQQPKVPQWGYTDEADPEQMAQKIDAAADHGIDAFIFDWYYYNDGLFLQRAIHEGFMGAKNNDRIKFALMWANHDWIDIHPVDSATVMSPDGPELLYPGVISLETWDSMTDFIISEYFEHPSYWTINGAPYFSIYDLNRFLKIFGSAEETAAGIRNFRNKVKAAGFNDLHLNAVVWGRTVLPSEEMIDQEKIGEFLEGLGFTSTTSYVWVHHVKQTFPGEDYNKVKQRYMDHAERYSRKVNLPYFPNVTMGWDSSPRCDQDDTFRELRYPFTGVFLNNTPENFRQALIEMKAFLDKQLEGQKIMNINCWNEWTEGSYLEPDTIHGMAYLEAVREVFGE
ncbi:MAG: glycoside hydrolase family 99-like domain-containing protein [Bacteroidales bacterium]|nr:glycoside hydrolase family 99-like domain-containing protein [Bacteroidales bacterium]